MLRSFSIVIGVTLVAIGGGCQDQRERKAAGGGPLYRHHFVGSQSALAGTNGTIFKEIWGLPTSDRLRQLVLDKIAKAPREYWKSQLPKDAPDHVELIRPLLDDLVRAESFLEVRGSTKRPEVVLAIELSDERAKLWQNNLSKVLSGWKQGNQSDLTLGGAKGWQIKRAQAPNLVQFVRAGKWVIVGLGQDQIPLMQSLAEQSSKTGRPMGALTNTWLELAADSALLEGRVPEYGDAGVPGVKLSIGAKGENVITEGKLTYAKPLEWRSEPWKIPTNTVTEPLVSFTVARGIAPLLKKSSAFRELGLKETPNQFCLWGQANQLCLTFLSVPVSDATNVITQLAGTLPKLAQDYMPDHMGQFLWISNRAQIGWEGTPFMVPRLQPVVEGGTNYVLASIFPKTPGTNAPPPAELMAQFVKETNVVYYDWEITPDRIKHDNQFLQLYNMVNKLKISAAELPTQAWLLSLVPHLRNTITEITATSPRELSLMRKSQVGLTGFEIALLMRWIESPGFPVRYERPPGLKEGLKEKLSSRSNAAPGSSGVIINTAPNPNQPPPPRPNTNTPPKTNPAPVTPQK